MSPSIEKLREYFLGKRKADEPYEGNSLGQETVESSTAMPPPEYRHVGSHPSSDLLLARLDEDPTFFESFTEQQHENGVFVQGNRFFRGSESTVREVEHPTARVR